MRNTYHFTLHLFQNRCTHRIKYDPHSATISVIVSRHDWHLPDCLPGTLHTTALVITR